MESEKLLIPLGGGKGATKGVTQLRVVLINPPITPFERYGSNIGKAGGRQVPLGICYIAAVLRLGKIDVKIIDAEAEDLDYKEIINRIKTFKADVVGITSTTVAFHRTLELTKKIKEYDKDLPVVLGGSHITALPDYSMSFDCFDYGVVGEGEITFYQLLQAINKGSDFEKVDGILFRKGGEIIKTKPREYIKDLDILPFPARDMLTDINLYPPPPMNYRHAPVLNLITSRGCPNRCIFCDRNVFGQRYREHSAEYVIKEIEHLVNEFGAKELAFVDDTFTINRKRVERIIDLMKERGYELDWTCMARVNTVTKDFLQRMKDSGCWHISYGIESGDQDVLDFIKKGINIDQIRTAIKWTDEVGINSKGFFIVGHLIDNEETIEKTIKFAKSLPLTDVVVTINTPIPNTEQYKIVKEYGELDTQDWSKFSYWKPVFVPNGLSEEYLMGAQKKFYREFYLQPRTIVKHLRQIKGLVDIKRYMQGVKALSFSFSKS